MLDFFIFCLIFLSPKSFFGERSSFFLPSLTCLFPSFSLLSFSANSYADVIVHRLLSAAIGVDPAPPGASPQTLASPKPELAHELVAENLNARHRGAQLAARASVELHTLLFFRARQRKEGKDGDGSGGFTIADARVVAVRANGVVVFVPRFGIEGPALFPDSEKDKEGEGEGAQKEWTLSVDGCGATDPISGKSLRVFDVATVRISVKGGEAKNGTSSSLTSSNGGGRERLVLELVDRSLLSAEDVATA